MIPIFVNMNRIFQLSAVHLSYICRAILQGSLGALLPKLIQKKASSINTQLSLSESLMIDDFKRVYIQYSIRKLHLAMNEMSVMGMQP